MSTFQKICSTILAVTIFLLASPISYAQDNADENTVNQHRTFLPLINSAQQSSTEQSVQEQPTQPQEFENIGEPVVLLDQLIIQLRDTGVSAATVDRLAQVNALSQAVGIELAYEREMSGDAIVVRLPTPKRDDDLREIADLLSLLPEVALAEPDMILRHQLTPNDPNYPQQWHYFTPSAGNYGINLPPAWDITQGSSTVVAAVIDTGIRPHADFAGRIVAGYDFISNVATANDGNGRDADASDPGDWITAAENASGPFAGCRVSNSSWHGTHVAGTVAANSNNGLGVAGVNWQSRILPVRVLGKCGGTTSDIIDGIRWAAGLSVPGAPANANPARVINMSLGGGGACSTAMQNAINAAVGAGTTVVVAAGNLNTNASNFQPANCANVITVSSTNRNGSRAYYSNFDTVVEISAPGGETNVNASNGVRSTLNTGTTTPGADSYAFYQGTSMAAPHVAGVVSLMLSLKPTLAPAQVLHILQNTVTPFPSGSSCNTSTCGTGIVNAANAVKATQKPSATYRAHVASLGWQSWVFDGATAGTTGQSRQMEALEAKLVNAPAGMQIKYRAHVAALGWLPWVFDGATAGTTGQSRRAEAFQIELVNAPAGMKVEYRAHVAGLGWLPWVSNGAIAGTTGQSRRIEAIEVRIVP
jgi:serine protease